MLIKIIFFFFITGTFNLTQASENDLYDFSWLDKDKAVFVLQNKIYEKKNTFYGNIGYGNSITNDFQDAKNLQLKAGYYFLEDWGVELVYTSVSNKDSDTLNNISINSTAVPFIRKFENYYGALAIWSPFYAKINTFNKIFYFDWNFGLGLGKINAESNASAFRTNNANAAFEKESFSAMMLKTEFRFYITRNINLNLSLFNHQWRADKPSIPGTKRRFDNTDFIFALGFSL